MCHFFRGKSVLSKHSESSRTGEIPGSEFRGKLRWVITRPDSAGPGPTEPSGPKAGPPWGFAEGRQRCSGGGRSWTAGTRRQGAEKSREAGRTRLPSSLSLQPRLAGAGGRWRGAVGLPIPSRFRMPDRGATGPSEGPRSREGPTREPPAGNPGKSSGDWPTCLSVWWNSTSPAPTPGVTDDPERVVDSPALSSPAMGTLCSGGSRGKEGQVRAQRDDQGTV